MRGLLFLALLAGATALRTSSKSKYADAGVATAEEGVAQSPAEAGTTPAGIVAQVIPGLLDVTQVEGQSAVAAGKSQLMLRALGASIGKARCGPTCGTCAPGMSTGRVPCEAADAKRAPGMSSGMVLCDAIGDKRADGANDVLVEVPVAKIVLGRRRLSA